MLNKGASEGLKVRVPCDHLCLWFTAAIRLNPYNEELLEQKATLLMQMGDYRRALECFETIFAVSVSYHSLNIIQSYCG